MLDGTRLREPDASTDMIGPAPPIEGAGIFPLDNACKNPANCPLVTQFSTLQPPDVHVISLALINVRSATLLQAWGAIVFQMAFKCLRSGLYSGPRCADVTAELCANYCSSVS